MWRVLLLLLLLAQPALAAQQRTLSFAEGGQLGAKKAQLLFCDMDGTPSNTQEGGEACASGDWGVPFDASGYETCWVVMQEFGTGSAIGKVWNCMIPILGQCDWTTTAPGTAVSASHECYCIEATKRTTLDGVDHRSIVLDGADFVPGLLIGEVETCTNDCTLRLLVFCGPRTY